MLVAVWVTIFRLVSSLRDIVSYRPLLSAPWYTHSVCWVTMVLWMLYFVNPPWVPPTHCRSVLHISTSDLSGQWATPWHMMYTSTHLSYVLHLNLASSPSDVLLPHRLHQQIYFYSNCTMKVVYYILKRTTQVAQNHFWVNLRVQVFSFFSFWGPEALFFDPNTLDGLRNPTFGGVILLTLFDLSNGFAKIGPFFKQNQPWKF